MYPMVNNTGKVYITDYISPSDIEREVLGDKLSGSLHEDIEVLLVWHEIIDKIYIDKLPKLKGIVRYGVGYDNLDIAYANSTNIYTCNTPDYGTEEVSDTAICMILNIARGVTRYDYQCRNYHDSWQENVIPTLRRNSEIVVGVLGAGRIGSLVATKAKALRFETIIYDPYKDRGLEKVLNADRVDTLDELLERSDIISFHAPLTNETKDMVNADFISKMKLGASFVNTARGNVVKDVDIFYDALKNEKLSCVALDVLPFEPPVDSRLIRDWREKKEWLDGRLIINPHSAYYSVQAYHEMRQKASINALRIVNNETPFNRLTSKDIF